MKPFVHAAWASAAALMLAGCGHSDKATEAAATENVEMPAEEAVSGVEATPAPEAVSPSDESVAASVAASDAAAEGAEQKAGAEAATRQAEKKM